MNDINKFFKGLKQGMKNFGQNISLIVNSTLLAIVYIIGVGLTSIFAKIFGKHFLDLKLSREEKTYWNDLNLSKKNKQEYFRQF